MDIILLLLITLAAQLVLLSGALPLRGQRYCAQLLQHARQQLPPEVQVPAAPPRFWLALHGLIWLAAGWLGWQLWQQTGVDAMTGVGAGTGLGAGAADQQPPALLTAPLRTALFGLLALQVLLLAGQRRWLMQLASSLTPGPSQRTASLVPRRLGLFVSPLRATLLALATVLPPLLALLLWQGGLWPKPLAVLWQLCLFTLLTDLLLAGLLCYSVWGPAPQHSDDNARQQLIARRVRRYSNAWLAFNALVCALMLQSLLGAQPALLYVVLSGSVQLLLLSGWRLR